MDPPDAIGMSGALRPEWFAGGAPAESWTLRKPAAVSAGGIVVSQHRLAARAGARVLAAGGNAFDAAVAASLAVGVVEPWMSGIGGGGYLVARDASDGRCYAGEFGMTAPLAIDPADYPLTGGTGPDLFAWPAVLDDRNILGPYSVAVPGLVAGLAALRARFGSRPWAELIEPAILLCEAGVPVDWQASLKIAASAVLLARFETSAEWFLRDGHAPVAQWAGSLPRLRNPALLATLRRLRDAGPEDFYEGETARRLVDDATRAGIRIDAADLARYRATIEPVEPLRYRRARVWTATGLSAGPTLCHALEMLEQALPQPARDGHAVPDAHCYAAYADCLTRAYDHRLVHDGDVADRRAPACTTHLGVVDRHGNAVALTQTLLSIFGSKLTLPGTGILMNNGIMWFDPRPGRANSIVPGRRPLSNMCPTLLETEDGRRHALGAAGGRRIMPAIFQIVSFLTDFGMDAESAAHQPRIDASGTGAVTVDAALGPEVMARLDRDHDLRVRPAGVYPNFFACPSIVCDDPGGSRHGAAFVHSPVAAAVAEDDIGEGPDDWL
jgi:gamma-glutamyltranspeptidase/glutathione hydrolase